MNVRRDARLRFLLFLLIGGCRGGTTATDLAAVADGAVRDALVFESCTTRCLRPSDCAIAFADDGYCPPGFACATTGLSNVDGAAAD